MYVSVQKVKGKSKVYGYPKDINVYTASTGDITKYLWHYSDDKFYRENYSYKIVVKESYRKDGKVKQKQVVMGTYHWFDFIDHYVNTNEWFDDKLLNVFDDKTEEEINNIYDEIDKKIREIEQEEYDKWRKSKEFKVHKKHLKIISEYEDSKRHYDRYIGEGYFEQIFDVHLNVMNQALCNEIPTLHANKEKADKEKREYERRSHEESQKQWEKYFNGFKSSYSKDNNSNYSEKEQEYLKKFYRVLAAKFHPDVTGDNEIMQFLNKLKGQWKV